MKGKTSIVITVDRNGNAHGEFRGRSSAFDYLAIMAETMGGLVKANLREGKDVMEALEAISEKCIIPHFLEGAGCKKKEEDLEEETV